MEEVVIIPKELFDRVLLRIGIMSDSYARNICLDLENCVGASSLASVIEQVEEAKEVQPERSIRFVDPFTFEIGEG